MENLHDFISHINEIKWFSRCGAAEERYIVAASVFEVLDCVKRDMSWVQSKYSLDKEVFSTIF